MTTRPRLDDPGTPPGDLHVLGVDTPSMHRFEPTPSELSYRSVITPGIRGIVVVGADGMVVYVSPSILTLMNAHEHDVVGRPGKEFLSPNNASLTNSALEEGRTGKEMGPIDLRLRTAAGTSVILEGFRTDLTELPTAAGVVWTLTDVTSAREMEGELARRDRFFEALAEGSSELVIVADRHGMLTYASHSSSRLFGYRPDELIGRFFRDFLHPEDADLIDSTVDSGAVKSREGATCEIRVRDRAGSWRWYEVNLSNLLADPAVEGFVANFRDVTERRQADDAMRKSEGLYRSIVETAEEGIAIYDNDRRLTYANAKMASLLGTTVEHLLEAEPFDLVVPVPRERYRRSSDRQDPKVEELELTLATFDGSTVDVLNSACPLLDDDGRVIGSLSMITDLTSRKQAERENIRLALEDPVTGLANRNQVLVRVTQILHRLDRHQGLAAVLFMDLDNFKQINDSLGHAVGDRILQITAERLKGSIRPDDSVGRFGGDEFVVLLDGISTPQDAAAVAERICRSIEQLMVVDGADILTSVSIGIAFTPALDAGSLLRDADTAMYRAKERGGARYEMFDSSLRVQAVARLELDGDLRKALERDEFTLHYQPVVSLDGTVTGFEALARWTHPTRGNVPPIEFIPHAEATGLIVKLGGFILREACHQLSSWQKIPGREALTMAVNLSGRQLLEPGFIPLLAGVLADEHLVPSSLCLEITESVLMDDAAAAATTLTAIHDLGVQLAVDDFGTGYSSLIYLRRFPVDALKLDRFFVAGIDQNRQDAVIIKSVVEMAHELGLVAIAEGVETASQLQALEQMGCDLAQGYYWSPGVPGEAAGALLTEAVLGAAADGPDVPGPSQDRVAVAPSPGTGDRRCLPAR